MPFLNRLLFHFGVYTEAATHDKSPVHDVSGFPQGWINARAGIEESMKLAH